MKIANKLSNKWWLLPTTVGLGLLMPKLVFAVDAITTFFGDTIMQLIMLPAWLLLQLEMWLLPKIAQYNNFINEPGVVIGWTALRDVSNMMFILVLLVIAFATILRVKSYGYKQLLSRLIIVAILINFSRTFVGLAIDLSQVVMLTFVQAIKDVAAENLIVALGLSQTATAGTGLLSFLASLILGAFMVVLAVVVIGVFIGMLAARVVTLWILIVLSPLAFLAYVFPRTQSYFNKWLSQLGSNLFSGPVLVFFLWLAFTITGRGDIYKSFIMDNPTGTVAGVPITDMSTAASPSNVINYVIAMVLLVSSLKFVGASGAAGASLASKAHKGATDYASKLARRYPMATLSRAGTFAASRLIDEEGKAKRAFGIIPSQWSRIPFVGGQVQRAAQKMQGYDAARIKKQQEEDTKYITPMQRTAFLKSQATMARGSKSRFARGLGRAYSLVSSQGGNVDKDSLLAAQMVDRGEITEKNADWATDLLRRTGDEERMQKVQGEYWTFAKGEQGYQEAFRLVRKKGIGGLLNDFNSNNLWDENGKPKEGAINGMNALFDPSHGHADPNAISAATLKMIKSDRGAFGKFVKENMDWGNGVTEISTLDIPEDGLEQDKRGIAQNSIAGNKAVIAGLTLAKFYPQMLGDDVDPLTGQIQKIGPERLIVAAHEAYGRASKIKSGQVGSRLQRWHYETEDEFQERKNEAYDLDNVYLGDPSSLPDYLREDVKDKDGNVTRRGFLKSDGSIDAKAFEAHRQERYKQIMGLDSMSSDKNGHEKFDYYNDQELIDDIMNPDLSEEQRNEKINLYALKYTAPVTARQDIISQAKTLAKESEEGTAARDKLFSTMENGAVYQRRHQEVVKELKQIARTKPSNLDPHFMEKFGGKGFRGIMERMLAEVAGNDRVAHGWMSKTFWTEVADGAHGSRFAEANVGNSREAVMLDHLIESSEHQQQAQAFTVMTEDQTHYFVDRLARYGKLPQKVLMDNIAPDLAAAAMQMYGDTKSMAKGVLPQSLDIVGQEFKKIAAILQRTAKAENKSIRELVNTQQKDENGKDIDNPLKQWLTGMQTIYRDEKYKKFGIDFSIEHLESIDISDIKIQEKPPKVSKAKEGENEGGQAPKKPKAPLFTADSGLNG